MEIDDFIHVNIIAAAPVTPIRAPYDLAWSFRGLVKSYA